MRFVAINRHPYHTWRMRIALLIMTLAAAAIMAPRADALSLNTEHLAGQEEYSSGAVLQVAQGGCTSLSQAIEQVRNRTGGKVISAETKVQGGREVHHIKVLTKDGKVKTHRVNGCKR